MGDVRSSFTVLPAVGATGVHAEVLPAPSTLRNCTWVVPSAATFTDAPEAGADQAPPFRLVRYSYPARPDPPVSVEPDAETATGAEACQDEEPPATLGADGSVRSIRTVAPTHAEVFPAPSTARSWTRVSPCAETVATAPAPAADQVAPPSVEVRCS